MPASLTKNGDQLEVALSGCRGIEFTEAKDKVKEVPGRRFDFDSKLWIVPATPANGERLLKTLRPNVDQSFIDWITESKASSDDALTTALPAAKSLHVPWGFQRMPWQPEAVNDEKFEGLLPYQRDAVQVMAERRRAILADDMGLGKTLVAISAVEEYVRANGPEDGVTELTGAKLVIAPSSVVGSWGRELARWLDDAPVQLVDGKTPAKRHEQVLSGYLADAWVVVNWEQLRVHKVEVKKPRGGKVKLTLMKEPLFEVPSLAAPGVTLEDLDWRAVLGEKERIKRLLKAGKERPEGWLAAIADEVHRAKNHQALQSQGLHRIQAPLMFGLTGTPIMNAPNELWSLLHWLWPEEYGDSLPPSKANPQGVPKVAYWQFYTDFVDYWEDHYKRKIITGVKNPDALKFVLRDKLIRRTAGEVLKGKIKGRRRIYFPVKLNKHQQVVYDDAVTQMWVEVERAIQEGDVSASQFKEAVEAGATIQTLTKIQNGASRLVRLQEVIENAALLGGEDDSALMDDFEQKFEDSRPNQWVVFCKFRESVNILARRMRAKGYEVGVYTGEVKPSDRTQLENQFQMGQIDVMIGTIAAMYQGITLTAAKDQFWMTRDFVPDINEQGEARCDRLGQQSEVIVYIPQAEDTVAVSKVDAINRRKETTVRTVIAKDNIKEVNA